MLIRYLRLGLLLATLLASLHVIAAERVWTLTGVQFEDGAVGTGYLGYDDATGRITDWNIRVSQGRSSWPIASFTYVPGNSRWIIFADVFVFDSTFKSLSDALAMDVYRNLSMVRLAQLDGSNVSVPLSTDNGADAWVAGDESQMHRNITAGSLVLAMSPPPVTIVQVDEFYHAVLQHYFVTADAAKKQKLDTGVHFGWVRTGESFKAYATGTPAGGSINPVCRYYGIPLAGLDSHFYSADADECAQVFWKYGPSAWLFESDNVFQINLPDKADGTCPVGTIPVYRLWNQRADSNHRYTKSMAIRAEMLAVGYLAEGYGTDGVAMCAVQ